MAVDVIGALYDFPDGPEGEAARLWGFHINVSPEFLAEHPDLETRIFQPETMLRVWAGDDPDAPAQTIRLRFSSDAAAREVMGDLWPEDAQPAAAPPPPKPK